MAIRNHEPWHGSYNLRDPLKFQIALYLTLLIFEGALRKWVLPGLSTPLLIVRDPLVAIIYVTALSQGKFPGGPFMQLLGLFLIPFAGVAMIQIGSGLSGSVAFFGLRTYFLHMPLIFLLPAVLAPPEVRAIGRWTLLISIPMTLLMIRQFQSSPYDLINVGVGGALGAQIESAMGKIRPAGTFSFVTGPVSFFAITASFLLYGYSRPGSFPRWLVLAATASMIAVLPVSGSRSLLLGCLLTACVGFLGAGFRKQGLSGLFHIAAVVIGLFYFLSMFQFFEEGKEVFASRWDSANKASGGWQESIVGRMSNTLLEPFRSLGHTGLFGSGIGMGTIAGARLATGRLGFLLAEGDWQRVIMEVGPILGVLYLGWRFSLVFHQGRLAWNSARAGFPLAWFLFAGTFMNTMIGQMGQPTQLGFIVVGAGLCLAALKEGWEPQMVPGRERFPHPNVGPRNVPGRSRPRIQRHPSPKP